MSFQEVNETNDSNKKQSTHSCIEVHFESETQKHDFSENAKWNSVFDWACRVFDIAKDACANLELRLSAPDGLPINEREKIGEFGECVTIWLVKPGPEQNG